MVKETTEDLKKSGEMVKETTEDFKRVGRDDLKKFRRDG